MTVRGFFIGSVIVIILDLGRSREGWIAGPRRLARSPIHNGQHERRGPENESEPEKNGPCLFRVTPVGQSVFETGVTIPSVGVIRGIFTPGLRPGGNCCNETGAGDCLEHARVKKQWDIRDQ